MWPRACVVHVVTGNNFVLNAEMIQSEDIICSPAFESVQVFYSKNVFYQFHFQPGAISYESFQMGFIQQIVYFLFVDLKIAAMNNVFFAA